MGNRIDYENVRNGRQHTRVPSLFAVAYRRTHEERI